MKKIIQVLKIAFIVILSIILILNLSIVIKSKINPNEVPSIFGYKPFVVTSGSMESAISVGDLVFVKNVNNNDLKTNDIIAFKEDDIITTHRIVEEVEVDGNRCFKTKGDSNNTIDANTICASQIEGKYVGKLAKIGSFILFIQKPLGFVVMMLILLIVCMLIYFATNRKTSVITKEELKEFEEFKKAKREKEKKQ